MSNIDTVISSDLSLPSNDNEHRNSLSMFADQSPSDSAMSTTAGSLTDNIDIITFPLLDTDDPEPLNLENLQEALSSWDVGILKDQAIERFKKCLSGSNNRLDLSSLGLTTLPDVIVRMPQLEFITLADNQFSEFPSQLKLLKNLRLLNLSYNFLTDLPDSLPPFSKLELINLANNYLRTIPEYLGHLELLGFLDLSDNPLDDDQLPQSLWFIPQVELNCDLHRQEHFMPVRFEYFSETFAMRWISFEEETGAEFFKTWLFKLAAILLAGKIKDQRAYFSQRLTCLMDAMAERSSLRQRCFSYAEESISTCRDGILFSVFEMECKYLEDEINQGILTKAEIYSSVESMYHFHRLQEKALEYLNLIHLQSGNPTMTEAEAIETVLGFISSPHNTLSMPIDKQQISMFYPSLSKATEQSIQEAVQCILDEKEKNMPKILINYIQEKSFWRNFLYEKHQDFIDQHLVVFYERVESLDARRSEYKDEDYLDSFRIVEEERHQMESSLYTDLTREFFPM